MSSRRPPKTHFVPRIIFKTTFAGVVPLCVAANACGGKANSGDGGFTVADMAFGDGGSAVNGGVASMAFGDAGADAKDAGVDDSGSNGLGVANMAFGDGGDGVFTVACIGFNGGACASVANAAFGDGGTTDASATDGAPDAAGDGHGVFTVAAIGFAVRSEG